MHRCLNLIAIQFGNNRRQGREIEEIEHAAVGVEEFQKGIQRLQEIATDEIANAERMLPIMEADPRIGYGYCYGPVYDTEMVRARIAQCRFVRDEELPRFSQVIRFHVWLDLP